MKEHAAYISDSIASHTIILPGMLDRKDYRSMTTLADNIMRTVGGTVSVIDMFQLDGVKRVTDSTRVVYDCDWTQADYFRKIKDDLDQHTHTKNSLVGFSYGAYTALLYGALDKVLGYKQVDNIAAIMPVNFFSWGEAYNPGMDLRWVGEQYRSNGVIDLSTTYMGLRHADLNHPSDDEMTVRVPRSVITNHTRPFEGFLQDNPISVTVTGLTDKGIMPEVGARTLVVAGENDILNDAEVTYNIYTRLPTDRRHFRRLKGVQHDYRISAGQTTAVNNVVASWLAAN